MRSEAVMHVELAGKWQMWPSFKQFCLCRPYPTMPLQFSTTHSPLPTTTTTTTPTTPTYFPFVYVHPTPTTYHLPPRLLHTSLLCPVPLHTSYLTCSSTTTTWTTTSDEQHVKPQNHTVIVSKLQRSIVTFSSTEDRKKKEETREYMRIPCKHDMSQS